MSKTITLDLTEGDAELVYVTLLRRAWEVGDELRTMQHRDPTAEPMKEIITAHSIEQQALYSICTLIVVVQEESDGDV